MTTLLSVLAALGIALNVYATVVLVRSPRYDAQQKWFQFGIIWLLPAVGAILVWSLAHDVRTRRATTNLGNDTGFDDGDIRLENYSSGEGGHGEGDGSGGGDGGGGGGGGD